MKRLILAQLVVCAVVCVVSSFFGLQALVSALLGGASYAVPSILAALIMYNFRHYVRLGFAIFFFAENLRVVLAIVLMAASWMLYPVMLWLPFLIGFIAVGFSAFFIIRD